VRDLVGMDVLLRPPGGGDGGGDAAAVGAPLSGAPAAAGSHAGDGDAVAAAAAAAAMDPPRASPLPVVGRVVAVMTRDQLAAGATEESTSVLGGDVLEVALGDWAAAEAPGGPGVAAWDWADAVRVLVPFVRPIVPVVDVERRVIEVDPPAGLFEVAVVPRRGGVKIRGLLTAAAEGDADGR